MAKVVVLPSTATTGAVFALASRSDYAVAVLQDGGGGVILEAKLVDAADGDEWTFINRFYGAELIEIDYQASLKYRFRTIDGAGPTVEMEAPSGVRIITAAT